MLTDELSEAEAGVILTDQAAHAIDAEIEVGRTAPELRARCIPFLQAFDDGLGRQLAGLQREQYARRIQRIEEAPGVTDEHSAISRRPRRPVGVVLGREESSHAVRVLDTLLDRRGPLHYLVEDLLE